MTWQISVLNQQQTRSIKSKEVKKLAASALEELGILECELGILLVGDAEMILLNEGYLQHEGSTDVITFCYNELPARGSTVRVLQGDIVICVDEALRMARRYGTSWQSEISRYVIHGLLHLCGYDDQVPEERREMKKKEGRLMKTIPPLKT